MERQLWGFPELSSGRPLWSVDRIKLENSIWFLRVIEQIKTSSFLIFICLKFWLNLSRGNQATKEPKKKKNYTYILFLNNLTGMHFIKNHILLSLMIDEISSTCHHPTKKYGVPKIFYGMERGKHPPLYWFSSLSAQSSWAPDISRGTEKV